MIPCANTGFDEKPFIAVTIGSWAICLHIIPSIQSSVTLCLNDFRSKRAKIPNLFKCFIQYNEMINILMLSNLTASNSSSMMIVKWCFYFDNKLVFTNDFSRFPETNHLFFMYANAINKLIAKCVASFIHFHCLYIPGFDGIFPS